MGHRLKIHGLDYDTFECRDFLQFYRTKYERLDILINNAAQTVRRPAGFYTHLMANEERPISALPKRTQDLLLDHAACLQELKVLTRSFF
jgi:hypothetical protein